MKPAKLLGELGLGKPRPLVCGILNVTPDSFSDGGQFFDTKAAIDHGLQMVAAGADMLDIGGESTRPNADKIAVTEETARVVPVILGIRQRSAIPISIDTMKPETAEQAMIAGAGVWNDVSALRHDARAAALAAKLGCSMVLMHMQGTPQTMQTNPVYDDVVGEVIAFLQQRIAVAEQAGIERQKIWVDPGIGFGKRLEDNLALLANLDKLAQQTGCPVFLGASRKRFIAELSANAPEDQRLGGSLACVAMAFAQNVSVVRVHDVFEAVQMLQVLHSGKEKHAQNE